MKKIIQIFTLEIDSKRIFGLDLLRAAAIIFVVISHQAGIWPKDNWYFGVFGKIMGYDGVSIFFVLSGFLIGGILIKILEKETLSTKTIIDFWKRRWYRTVPNYIFILLIMCLLHYFFTNDFQFIKISNFFIFSQNIVNPHPGFFFPEAWSLTIEEWFYLITPVLIFIFIKIFKQKINKSILFTAFLILFSVTFFRYYRYSTLVIQNYDDWDLFFRKQVATRLDSLMFGILAAYIQFYHSVLWHKYKNIFLYLGLILFFAINFIQPKITSVNGFYNTVLSFSITSIATSLLLPFLSNMKGGKSIFHKTITYVSLISYSLYLLNLSIVNIWIINNIPWQKLSNNQIFNLICKNLSYWIILVSLSILLYKYFEIPMTKLRDRKK